MPTKLVQAAATGLPFVSRRSFLGGMAVTAIPSAALAADVGNSRNEPMTAQERFDFHLAEFKKAAEELDPMIGHWQLNGARGDEAPCVVVLSAFRLTGRYEGDGKYQAGRENWNGKRTEYSVRLLSDRVDGERLFEVACPGERMQLIETRLNTFIGRKLA